MPRQVDVSEADLQKVRGYPSVQRWIRDLEPPTRLNYLRTMVSFNRASGMDPDQSLSWAKTRPDPLDVIDLVVKTGENFTESNRVQHTVALRSFFRHNGFNGLPRQKINYVPQDWHRGYRRDEVRKLLGYLDSKPHKLYGYLAIETGLRAKTILALHYHHVKEDLKAGVVPCAVRLEPKFYNRAKSAGFTFLGERSLSLLKECIKDRLIDTKADSPLVPLAYSTIIEVITRAKEKAGVDPKVQPNHGFRKYFENALDKAGLDPDRKALLEGHFSTVRAKSYTDREWDQLREDYVKAYPFIDAEGSSPEVTTEIGNLATENAELKTRLAVMEKLLGPSKLKTIDPLILDVGLIAKVESLEKLVRRLLSKKTRS